MTAFATHSRILQVTGTALAVVVFMVATIMFSTPTYAATAQINYQGKLLDNTSSPVADGSYSMTFSLYNVATGGSAIWTESGSTTVQNGLFSVMLGATTSLASVDFSQDLYLGINVEGDGEMTPRKVLGTVPAAFQAENADTVGGVASSSFLRNDIANSASALLSFTGGIFANSSSTITDLYTGTTTVTVFDIDGQSYTSISGGSSGLTNNAGVLTANISESNLNIAGSPTNGYVLQASSTASGGFVWQATSSLGFSSQTLSIGTDNQIPFVNAAGDDLEYSSAFTFDGINLDLAGTNTGLAFQGTRFFYASTTLNNIAIGNGAGEFMVDNGNIGDGSNVYLGDRAGQYASSTGFTGNEVNNFIGSRAGQFNTGSYNNIMGLFSGQYNTGDFNNILSYRAGQFNTGDNNNLFGFDAGNKNTGSDNNLFGTAAGYDNIGDYNNLFGYQAGDSNIGDRNNIFGYWAGFRNTGSFNNFFGALAGFDNTGSYSEFIGFETGLHMSASRTIAIGGLALRGGAGSPWDGNNATTTNNVAIGYGAGYNVLTGGDNNILLGYQAADSLTTGANNIIIGYDVEAPSNTGDNQLNIGNLLFGTGIDGTGTSLSSGNIGIGTSSPASKLDVWGDFRVGTSSTPSLFVDTSAAQTIIGTTTAYGSAGLYLEDSSIALRNTGSLSDSVDIGIDGSGNFYTNASGNAEFIVAGDMMLNLLANNSVVVNPDAQGNIDFIVEGDADAQLLWVDSGLNRVGISTSTPSQMLTVDGNAYITGALYDSTNNAGTNGYILQTTGAGTQWVATSSLGITGGGSALTVGSDNQIPFTNAAGDDLEYSSAFTFDGTDLNLGGTNTGLAFQGTRFFYASTTNDSIAIGEGAGASFDAGTTYSVALGYQAGMNASTTAIENDWNVYIGDLAGYQSAGRDNNFVGSNAGYSNTGSYNNAFGRYAGRANEGSYNNLFGGEAGENNTGLLNNIFGFRAGEINAGRSNNIFGYYTGAKNSGSYNNIFGESAGYNNTGSYSEFIGFETGAGMSASSSVAIGGLALRGGSGSIFFGNNATTTNNVAIGYGAGYNVLTGGDNNILLGYQAADSLTTGANNIIIGYDVEAPSNTGDNQLNIGNLIFGTGIDGTGTSLSSGNIGIGTSSPYAKLSVAGDAIITGALYDNNYSAGTNGMVLQSTGSGFNWVATSSLGITGGGSALTVGSDNQIPFTNAAGDDLEYSSSFTFDGTNLNLGGTNTGLAFQGTRVFYASTTNNSIAIGEGAGESNTGSYNNLFGYLAGQNNTGSFNNLLGFSAGQNNTGSSNNLFGYSAGQGNTGANNNLFGRSAGTYNTGSYNNIFGTEAGYNNTGSYSEFIGFETGARMSASRTIAIGGLALRGGAGATWLGNNATTTDNVAIGYGAGYNVLTGGDNNILLGYQAADSLTTGANNIIIGYDVEAPSNTGSNQLNIGNLLFGTGIDGTGTSLSSGNIGIGTSSPYYRFEVDVTPANDGFFGISAVSHGDVLAVDDRGYVGIGTSSPTSKLTVRDGIPSAGYQSDTAESAAAFFKRTTATTQANEAAQQSVLNVDPGGDSQRAYLGSSAEVYTDSWNSNDLLALVGASADATHYGGGHATSVIGSLNNAYGWSDGSITNLRGVIGSAINLGTQEVSNMSGVLAQGVMLGGTTTNYAGLESYFEMSSGLVTNYKGVDVNAPVLTGGTITNAYGLYIEDHSAAASSAWNLYVDGATADNYIAGNLGIGTSSPASKLDVWGDLQVGTSSTPTLYANPGNGFVGVGRSTPGGSQSYSFAVSGGIYSDGNIELLGTNKIFGTNTGVDTGLSFPASNTFLLESSNSDVLRASNLTGPIFNGENVATMDFRIEADVIDDLFFADAGLERVGIATDTPTHTFTVEGDIYTTGALYDSTNNAGTNGYILQTTGAGTQWVATSSLGISGGSALTVGSDNQIPFTNAAGDDLEYSSAFTFDGTDLNLGGTNTGLAFQGTRFFYASTTLNNIAIGNGAGEFMVDNGNSGDNGNIFLGYQAGRYASSTGASGNMFNSFIGFQAGYNNTGGGTNLFGYQAGFNNTGDTNNLFGALAGANNTGDNNNIFGYAAGAENTGDNNNLFGYQAGAYNTGDHNNLFGTGAGGNSTGDNNNLFGHSAGLSNTGSYSEFIGYEAGGRMSASSTIAIGGFALHGGVGAAWLGNNATTTNNVAIGYGAGYNVLTGGDNNILLGYQAADSLTTGANNIIIGYDVEAPSNTGSNQLNIGNLLFGTGIDGTGTSLSSGNIGIGTSSPNAKLSIENTGFSGAGIIGQSEYLTSANSVESALQYGSRQILNMTSNTATTSLVANAINITDGTTYGNTVRGIEVQADLGGNTQGENTGISSFARTFGLRAFTSADAGGSFEPAAGFFELGGSGSQGNALRAYSSNITSSAMVSLFQDTSTFTGTGLLMNFGNTTGSFASTSSKFADFQNAGTSVFTVSAFGTTTIGDGSTMAGLQVPYGGICVDNDGSCVASTTGTISAVDYLTGNSDLAEMYFSSQALQPGELVVSDEFLSIERAEQGAGRILGVVSTKPGLTLGGDDTSHISGQKGYPLALTGRVPVRLSTENGSIAVGDPLTLSTVPGVAMKATEADVIVGYALEAFDGERAYSDGYINQFGDDIAEPNYSAYEAAVVEKASCYYGAGAAAGRESEPCDPEETPDYTAADEARAIAEARYEAEMAALEALRYEAPEVVSTANGAALVGQVVMFVDRGIHLTAAQTTILNELTSTSSALVLGAEIGSDETLWSRIKVLAQNFVDGVLAVTGIKADKIETDELCVDGVCVTGEQLRALLEADNSDISDETNNSETDTTNDDSNNSTDNPDNSTDDTDTATTTENDTGTDTSTSTDNGSDTSAVPNDPDNTGTTTVETEDESGTTTVPVETDGEDNSAPTDTDTAEQDDAVASGEETEGQPTDDPATDEPETDEPDEETEQGAEDTSEPEPEATPEPEDDTSPTTETDE